MKTPNDYPQVKFRLGVKSRVGASVAERSDKVQTDVACTHVVRRDVDRYYLLIPHLLPAFSEQEALLLVTALNGVHLDNERADKIWAEIEDEALSKKIKALPFPECVAVLDAVERFWQGSLRKTAEETRQRLREVGLIEEDGAQKR